MMKALRPELLIKALELYAETHASEPEQLFLFNQLEGQADILQERASAVNLLTVQGGTWLGSVRDWIQRKAINGETVSWNSNDQLTFRDGITVADLELLAAVIAADALNEFKGQA